MSREVAPTGDGGTTVCYRGWLRYTSNSDYDHLLAVPSERRESGQGDGEWWNDAEDRFLAAAVASDIGEYGPFLTVRLWTSAEAMPPGRLKEEFLKELFGAGTAEYATAYSEDTGYLWTDESLSVGGHDLLAELESQIGRFAHLEITYHQKVPRQ